MENKWPLLDFNALKNTIEVVQLWTQIIGKVRLTNMPWINHSWHVSLYLSSRGLTTASIPFDQGVFQIDLDFIDHSLKVSTSTGKEAILELNSRSVADFFREFRQKTEALGINCSIYACPNEIDPAVPFEQDTRPRAYDPGQMNALYRAWISMYPVFTTFRAKFAGKCSPVHFFWGGFDLAVTRFSGRRAPAHPGGAPNIPLAVMQEAYSHEVSSAGFWAGSEQSPSPIFYSYCYPTPAEFGNSMVSPAEAFYSNEMGEFFLPYEEVRHARDPEEYLLSFLQSTYEAAALTGQWDRQALEADFSALPGKK